MYRRRALVCHRSSGGDIKGGSLSTSSHCEHVSELWRLPEQQSTGAPTEWSGGLVQSRIAGCFNNASETYSVFTVHFPRILFRQRQPVSKMAPVPRRIKLAGSGTAAASMSRR